MPETLLLEEINPNGNIQAVVESSSPMTTPVISIFTALLTQKSG